MNVKLKVIPKPSNSRTQIIFDNKNGPILKGTAMDIPSYCCGQCGTVLVEGIHAKQFVDKSRELDSAGARIVPLDFPAGGYRVSQTLNVPADNLTVFSENGPLVLTCGQCQASNEMVTPNQIFDKPR
jgi:hypothetical protein